METALYIVLMICSVLAVLMFVVLVGSLTIHYRAQAQQANAIADHYNLVNGNMEQQHIKDFKPGFRTTGKSETIQ